MTPLRRRMIEDMRIRNLAPLTQSAYLEHVQRFACHFHKSPEQLGPGEIRGWLIHLTEDKQLAASWLAVMPSHAPVSASRSHRILSATPLRWICWKPAPIYAPSSS